MGRIEVGKKYYNLTVLRRVDDYVDKTGKHRKRYLCQCDCGKQKVLIYYAIGKTTKSCGCIQKGSNVVHGQSKTRLHHIWKNMRQRCNNPNNPSYKYYGAKGVKICAEWDSFEVFQEWALKNGYKEDLTIERKNVYGNYEPSNCEWIPFKLQLRNRTDTPKLTYKGVTKPVIEWAEEYNLDVGLVRRRIRLGWDLDRVFNEKPYAYMEKTKTGEKYIRFTKHNTFRVCIKGKYYETQKTLEKAIELRDKILKENTRTPEQIEEMKKLWAENNV